MPSKQDAEELTAETFTGAWTYFCGEVVHSAVALLYRIARYRVAEFYRSRASEAKEISLEAEHLEIAGVQDAAKEAGLSQEMHRVRSALKELPLEYAQIITMRYLDEMDVSEIAEALGKTANGVRVTLHRALATLRTHLLLKDRAQDRDHGETHEP